MKRSLKGTCKYLALGVITIFTTVVIFKYVRPPKDNSSSYHAVRGVNPVPPPEKLVKNSNVNEGSWLQFNLLNSEHGPKIDWHNYEQLEEEKARTGKIIMYGVIVKPQFHLKILS